MGRSVAHYRESLKNSKSVERRLHILLYLEFGFSDIADKPELLFARTFFYETR